MSTASNALVEASQVDWNIVAAAAATFIITSLMTWAGLRKGKDKASKGETETISLAGGSIMDNQAMRDLTEALKDHTRELSENSRSLKDNTTQLTMANMALMSRGKR